MVTSHSADPTPVLSLRGVTKTYTLWDQPSARFLAILRRTLHLPLNRKHEEFTAVRDISLDLMPGECLGIIGRNGAGKSTLLQMIAGTVQPTSGQVRVNGRVAALLELGSGFNPDFTGRENVRMNALILGLSAAEIEEKYESIVEYSGIREFIDRPVRTYSSGMTLRLAFAVCVHVNADILIIDEALAVGDARFQFKCHATLETMIRAGRTIIFVSHDTNAVKRMCRTAILLERGEVLLKGTPNDVTNIYTKLITSPHGVESIRADIALLQNKTTAPISPSLTVSVTARAGKILNASIAGAGAESELLAEERAHLQISDKEYAYGGEQGRIARVVLCDADDRPRVSFVTGDRARIRIVCEAIAEVPDPIYALTIKDVRGQEIYGTNTYFQDLETSTVPAGAHVQVSFSVQLNIQPGVYFISLGWVRLENGEVKVIHRRYDVIRFDLLLRDKSFGIAYCPTSITVAPPSL